MASISTWNSRACDTRDGRPGARYGRLVRPALYRAEARFDVAGVLMIRSISSTPTP